MERLASRPHPGVFADGRESLADEHEGDVGERREVAAGADRAAARHDRVHPPVEQREQVLDRVAPDAREPFGEHIGAQRHRRAHRASRQRLADAGGMAAQQVQLQLLQVAARDDRFGERAEAGVDAVHRPIVAGMAIDDGA